jgi:hypothetical protein
MSVGRDKWIGHQIYESRHGIKGHYCAPVTIAGYLHQSGSRHAENTSGMPPVVSSVHSQRLLVTLEAANSEFPSSSEADQ